MKHILASVMIFLGGANLPATGQSFSDGFNAYSAGNYITAYQNWRPLAEQGVASAQYNLGVMYDNGQGVLQDYTEAMRWWRLAAYQGDADAQKQLCRSYGYNPNTEAFGDCMMQIDQTLLAQEQQAAAEAQARLARFHSEVAQARHQARQAAALTAQEEIARRERQRRAEAGFLSAMTQFGLNMALGNTNSFSLPPSTSSSSPSAGFFQTCRYNVMGEVVSTSQSSASLCPISRSFNGKTGYLVN